MRGVLELDLTGPALDDWRHRRNQRIIREVFASLLMPLRVPSQATRARAAISERELT